MTNRTEILKRGIDTRTTQASEAFEAGFASKAAQKRALDHLNHAFDCVREMHQDAYIAAAPYQNAERDLTPAEYEERGAYFDSVEIPFDLHLIRDRHFERLSADHAATVRRLADLRAAIKAAEIKKVEPANAQLKEARKRVELSVAELMEKREAQFIEAVELGELFNHLPVTINAHWVNGHKGARFIRCFYYLSGKLTPLNVIIAAAQELARREKS